MNTRKLTALPILLIASSAMFSASSYADGKHNGNHKPLKGCYEVVRGGMEESPTGNQEVVGTYQLVLAQSGNSRDRRKHVIISGPMAGNEDLAGHEEGDEGEGEETHGKHAFGTYERSGVLIAHETAAAATGFDCFINGIPHLISGTETIEFDRGTGAYSGLIGGEIIFEGTFDRCTDPNNPIATFEVSSGELCFQE